MASRNRSKSFKHSGTENTEFSVLFLRGLRASVFQIFLLAMIIAFASRTCDADQKQPVLDQPAAERLFTLKVLPLLKVKCFGCHGSDPKDIRGEFNLLSREGMLKGGESEEPSLVPGKPKDSPLYLGVMWNGLEMPPKENDRLTKNETEYIRKWILAEAPWPDAKRQLAIQKKEWSIRENEDGVIVDTSGGLADNWTYRRYKPEDIWAFQPVVPMSPFAAMREIRSRAYSVSCWDSVLHRKLLFDRVRVGRQYQ